MRYEKHEASPSFRMQTRCILAERSIAWLSAIVSKEGPVGTASAHPARPRLNAPMTHIYRMGADHGD